MLVLGVVAVFAIGGFFISIVFAGATVTVHPRQVTVEAPTIVEARLSAPVGGLEYKTISAARDSSITIESSGETQVSRQASGVLTISNAYSADSQRLIANTRFEAPDGKIYRIRDSVTLPGMSGGKAGTATATVYADSPGASYNKTGTVAFKIPGFKGDPKYEKITATSQGPIAGGFVGMEPAVAAADLQKAKDTLQKKLDADARAAVTATIPDGYGLLPNTLSVTYSEISQVPASGGKVTVTQSATATGAIVNGNDLGTTIARAKVAGYDGESVEMIPDNLTVTASSTGEGVLSLTMSGSATLVWQFDPNALREALLAKSKGEFKAVIDSFKPAIECTEKYPCDVRIRPFWAGTFPTDLEKIKVVTKTGE